MKLKFSLLLLRLSVFLVMLMWTLDKFFRPEHAAKVYEIFYKIPAFGPGVSYLIGAVELLILIAFVFGLWKTLTYGLVLIFHAISTLCSFSVYLTPFEESHLLFFAAWPMLAACITLWLLRKEDTLLTLTRKE